MIVRAIERAVAGPFIKAHHYSGTVPTGFNLFFGCYVNDLLFAVVDYGSIASRTPVAYITGQADATKTNTLELRRLCRVGARGEKGPVQLSDVLRMCHHKLVESGYRYILSYSDHAHNARSGAGRFKFKSGSIYHYTGFTHIGETPIEMHCKDKDGRTVHRSRAYRKMLAHNIALCAKLGLTVATKPTGNKDRIWPTDTMLWATDASLPQDKLWTLQQVRENMGLTVFRSPPKDKWLLHLHDEGERVRADRPNAKATTGSTARVLVSTSKRRAS